jgi:hypothetical protein
MPDPTSSNPLALNRPDDVNRVRDVLDRVGFEDRKVRERLRVGATADLSFGPLDRPRVLRRTGDGDALATLIRVFVAGVPVPLEVRVSQRLGPTESGWMVERADCILGAGPRFEGEFNPLFFHLLTLCRGHLPLSAVLSQVACRLGQDEKAIRAECLDAVRSLVVQGFLQPANPGESRFALVT